VVQERKERSAGRGQIVRNQHQEKKFSGPGRGGHCEGPSGREEQHLQRHPDRQKEEGVVHTLSAGGDAENVRFILLRKRGDLASISGMFMRGAPAHIKEGKEKRVDFTLICQGKFSQRLRLVKRGKNIENNS